MTFLKGYGNIFLMGLSLRTIEITLKSAFKFLIACLAFEIFKDKEISHPPSWMFKKSMTSQAG